MPISFDTTAARTAWYLKDTMAAFIDGEYTIYKLSPVENFNTGQNIKGSEPYFIRRGNEKFGFYYETYRDTGTGIRYDADSFILAKKMVKDYKIDLPTPETEYVSAGIVKNASKTFAVESYHANHKPHEGEPDSLVYYYTSTFPEAGYALSKKIDSLRGMKLYKFRMVYNEAYSQQQKRKIPEYAVLLELRQLEPELPKEVTTILDHFMNTHKN